jgi:hypothetical protein
VFATIQRSGRVCEGHEVLEINTIRAHAQHASSHGDNARDASGTFKIPSVTEASCNLD